MTSPLSGLQVIDMTTTLSGPYATLLLADLGADVIKIESPSGDPVRRLGPRVHEDMGAVFMNFNRAKRSVVLDLDSPADREGFHRLVDEADVFVHNLRPSTAARREVSARHLRSGRPRLIHCAIRGYGEGPYGDRPAYDDVVQAGSGLAAEQAWMAGEPQYVASALVDKIVGQMAAMAISAAVVEQVRTGRGCAIEVPMFETAVAFGLADHLYGRTFVPPKGEARYPRQSSPDRRPYRTSDGWLALLVYTDSQWERFAAAVGRPELLADDRFATLQARVDHIAEMADLIESVLQSDTSSSWLERLTAAGLPAGPVNTLDDLFTDEHLLAGGLFQLSEHPSEGPLFQVASPIVIDSQRAGLGRPAPRLGEHTAEILSGRQ